MVDLGRHDVQRGGGTRRICARGVRLGDYFGNLGIVPAYGRLIDASDAQLGAESVAVVGYDYWRNHQGADPNVIGRIARINNQPVQIAGVLPHTFPRSLLARRAEV